ncbi:MAG: alpha/beta hydrolase [Actinobacteria bacterium]|nr:alpha/beta hydrolase [Actinomycetota bacterium]
MGNRKIRCLLAASAVVAVIAGCSSSGSGAKSPGTTSASTVDVTTTLPEKPVTYTEGACPVPVPDSKVKVTCGTLTVPENRLVANSPTIELAVAWMHSTAAHPLAPVVELGGGPGFPSIEKLPSLVKSKLLASHDLIVWDQRGIGFSKPNLDCPEYAKAVFAMLNSTEAPSVGGAHIATAVQACHERLVAEHIDLDGFTTTQNADDLADLRVALKIPEWNLHAGSYGTAVGLEELRTHPEGIRSLLLDSVVPPDKALGALDRVQSAQRAFDVLAATCAAQAACKAKYGDIEALLAKAAKALDDDPYHTVVTDDSDGTKHDMTITGDDLYAGIFQAMYSPDYIKAIPAALQQIADGQRGIIGTLASSAVPLATGSSTGMMLSINCSDRQRLLDKPAFDRYMAKHPQMGTIAYLAASEDLCPGWGVTSVPAAFNAMPKPTKVPVLVTAGTFDPITPPAGSKRVARALGAPFLEFADAGHGAVGPSQCSFDIWLAFMADPTAKLDTSCVARVPTLTIG